MRRPRDPGLADVSGTFAGSTTLRRGIDRGFLLGGARAPPLDAGVSLGLVNHAKFLLPEGEGRMRVAFDGRCSFARRRQLSGWILLTLTSFLSLRERKSLREL